MADQWAERWRRSSLVTLATAKHLRERTDYRSCVSRAYYAIYQAGTSVSIAYGDSGKFPADWNNPTHEQLPNLIKDNGSIPLDTRRQVAKVIRQMRTFREDADYRQGITVDKRRARQAVLLAVTVCEILEMNDD
jgi:uncharacterized protein (UPF0332 family)